MASVSSTENISHTTRLEETGKNSVIERLTDNVGHVLIEPLKRRGVTALAWIAGIGTCGLGITTDFIGRFMHSNNLDAVWGINYISGLEHIDDLRTVGLLLFIAGLGLVDVSYGMTAYSDPGTSKQIDEVPEGDIPLSLIAGEQSDLNDKIHNEDKDEPEYCQFFLDNPHMKVPFEVDVDLETLALKIYRKNEEGKRGDEVVLSELTNEEKFQLAFGALYYGLNEVYKDGERSLPYTEAVYHIIDTLLHQYVEHRKGDVQGKIPLEILVMRAFSQVAKESVLLGDEVTIYRRNTLMVIADFIGDAHIHDYYKKLINGQLHPEIAN